MTRTNSDFLIQNRKILHRITIRAWLLSKAKSEVVHVDQKYKYIGMINILE
jgi:hypothetical protein